MSEAQDNPLRDRLLRNERSQQLTGWYQRADTGEFFQFDRSGDPALLRERDDSEAEVLVLYPNRAPGGGTAFVTDTGREVMRLTGLGGATYFPPEAPNGVIVEYASPAGGIAPTPRSASEVRGRASRLADDLARWLNRDILIEYTPAPRAGLGVQYDTLNRVIHAVDMLRGERQRIRDLESIRLVTGDAPAAYRTGTELVIVIAPQYGFAGRPSSAYIREAFLSEPNES